MIGLLALVACPGEPPAADSAGDSAAASGTPTAEPWGVWFMRADSLRDPEAIAGPEGEQLVTGTGLRPPATPGADWAPEAVATDLPRGAFGDIDGDGLDDAAWDTTACSDYTPTLCACSVSAIAGPFVGAFSPERATVLADLAWADGVACSATISPDLDGQAGADLVAITDAGAPNAAAALFPLVGAAVPVLELSGGWPVGPGDLDGDGFADLLVQAGSTLRAFAGPLSELRTEAEADATLALGDRTLVRRDGWGDLDGDGANDLVLLDGHTVSAVPGSLADAPLFTLLPPCQGVAAPLVADLAGDTRAELVLGCSVASGGDLDHGWLSVYVGPLEGTLTEAETFVTWTGREDENFGGSPAVVDLDGEPGLATTSKNGWGGSGGAVWFFAMP